MTRLLLLLLSLLAAPGLFAQAPHLSGSLRFSVQDGSFDAELTLSRLPRLPHYSLWLNTGFNIEYFRDSSDRFNYGYQLDYQPELASEPFQYYFPGRDSGRFLPPSFRVKYTGKFPVIRDTLRAYEWGDWKGNMAFNGRSLRASEQSAWYPILYDAAQDRLLTACTYDLHVICQDCKTLYVNGSEPVSAQAARFVSDVPVPLLLFAGDYDFARQGSIYLLNTALTPAQRVALDSLTRQIIAFLEATFAQPYGKPVTYLSSSPVSKRNEWLFVSYPTIAVVALRDYTLEAMFDGEAGRFRSNSDYKLIAHELAHYYIGTRMMPNSSLRWFFLEGVTEYAAIQALRAGLGEEVYRNLLAFYVRQVGEDSFPPLSAITASAQIGERYRYTYAPLLLTALEREAGRERMIRWLRLLLAAPPERSDYDFFRRSLAAAGLTEAEWQRFEAWYISHPEAKQHVLDRLK